MKTSDFDYFLPEELIAQEPILNREESRLLILEKNSGKIEDKKFYNIIDYLDKDSILVINNTKVVPARILGRKEETNAKIELLLLKDLGDKNYECLAKPQRRLKIGTKIIFKDNILEAKVIDILPDGIVHVQFIFDGIFYEVLDEVGEVPLPPYIHKKLDKIDRYQTVYSKIKGSTASPTAGLHFTQKLLDDIKAKGIEILEITLTIGLGTFRPVNVDNIEDHKMHSEKYHISKEVADKLNKAKENHKKIVAVGTTSVRTLESNYKKFNKFMEEISETSIFIYPGYKFMAVDELITNFHLPKSTLIMLVSAFSSRDNILNAYKYAVQNKFRFFSFGDAMYIKDDKEEKK